MAFKQPTGKTRTGEQKNQFNVRTGVAAVTGSKVINPGLSKRTKKDGYTTSPSYEVIGLIFEDAGGADAEAGNRVSAKKNSDGTFTIYVEDVNVTSAVENTAWAPAVSAVNVRWTILITG